MLIHLPGHRQRDSWVMLAEIEAVQPIHGDGTHYAKVITKSGKEYLTTDTPAEVNAKIAAASPKPQAPPKIPATKVKIQEGFKPKGKK